MDKTIFVYQNLLSWWLSDGKWDMVSLVEVLIVNLIQVDILFLNLVIFVISKVDNLALWCWS